MKYFILIAAIALIGAAQIENSFSSKFKLGETVSIKETNGHYKITKQPVGSKIVEVGKDYIVISDMDLSFTTIPFSSISAIVEKK